MQHKQLGWQRHDGIEMKGFTGTFTLWSVNLKKSSRVIDEKEKKQAPLG